MNWNIILTALTAVLKFLTIIFTKSQEVKAEHIKEQNDLKEEMHRALLAGDNNAIVMCLNKYSELRAKSKA